MTPLADPRRDPWAPVFDELEQRVDAAESGDLAALDGWAPPAAQQSPMTSDDQHRASGILARQRALLARLRDERAEVASALAAMRRPAYRPAPAAAAPVYLDRLG